MSFFNSLIDGITRTFTGAGTKPIPPPPVFTARPSPLLPTQQQPQVLPNSNTPMTTFGGAPTNPQVMQFPSFGTQQATPQPTPIPTPAQPAPTANVAPAPRIATPASPQTGGMGQIGQMLESLKTGLTGLSAGLQNHATPASPTLPSETQTALTAAEKAYQQSLKISPEELSTQEDLDKLIEATKNSYSKIQDQPIALGFITGQMASVERRAANLAEPLSRKLARMQAARTGAMEASKFALERADKLAEAERATAGTEKEYAFKRAESEEERKIKRESLGQTQKQFETEQEFNKRKFDEDTRRFGLEYAQANRKIAIDEAKLKAEMGTPGAIKPEIGQALQLVSSIIPNAGAISGAIQTGILPFTSGKATYQQYEQLKSVLALGARSLIKGSGAVSDYEARTLENSTNAMNRATGEGTFTQSLKDVRGVLNANAGLPVSVDIIDQEGNVVDSGRLYREDIYDAASQGYKIKYQ